MITTQHQLGIVHQVNGEEQCSQGGIDQSDHLARYEDSDYTKNDEDHQTGHQHSSAHRKIVFGLQGKQGESQGHRGRNSHCHQDLISLKLSGDHTQKERLRHGEQEKKDEVKRRLTAYTFAAGHTDHGHDKNGLSLKIGYICIQYLA
uniref:MIP15140p n=1 Tax=Drosophila melanogaster TaxID=7227 RepID=D0Z722_DROME|nr:MIP15140p [Drosophila melanogaster]